MQLAQVAGDEDTCTRGSRVPWPDWMQRETRTKSAISPFTTLDRGTNTGSRNARTFGLSLALALEHPSGETRNTVMRTREERL